MKARQIVTLRARTILRSEYSIILVFVVLSILMSVTTPRFATISNILNVVKHTAITGIVALGMTYVIATAGIDLSVGGQVCFIAYLGTYLLLGGVPIPVVVLLMIVFGGMVGVINGFLVAYARFPAFMATLAMMEITKGMSLFVSSGRTVFNLPNEFGFFGLGSLLGIPVPVWIFVLLVVIAHLGINNLSYGRKVLSVGSNEKGAWYSGVNTALIKFSAYIVSGLAAGAASVITTSQLLSASPTMGTGLELDAIAAVVIGGTNLAGGSANIVGSVVGALIIEMIGNVMNLQGVNAFLQGVIKGMIILLALLIDASRKGRFFRKQYES